MNTAESNSGLLPSHHVEHQELLRAIAGRYGGVMERVAEAPFVKGLNAPVTEDNVPAPTVGGSFKTDGRRLCGVLIFDIRPSDSPRG